ncbi:hypothetical protein L7F22_043234 [Adiantum nelumboides]|nr:hypothetical protein [Adiantum nelumboides]
MADKARHAQENAHGFLHKLEQHKPTSSQVVGFLTLLTTASILLFLGGLAVAATVTTLVILTPLFIFFSPILVPAGFLLVLAFAATLTAGGFAIAAGSAIFWLYKYIKGRHPPGSDHVEYACARIHDTAAHMRGKARDLAGTIQGSRALQWLLELSLFKKILRGSGALSACNVAALLPCKKRVIKQSKVLRFAERFALCVVV